MAGQLGPSPTRGADSLATPTHSALMRLSALRGVLSLTHRGSACGRMLSIMDDSGSIPELG